MKKSLIKRLLAAIGAHELTPLVLIGLLAAGIWVFAALADEVTEGDTQKFDTRVLMALRQPGDVARPIGPPSFQEACRDFTGFGGFAALTLLTLFATGALALQRKGHAAILLLAAVGSGAIASNVLKHLFNRPRPALVPHLSYVYTTSFPSGHSMMSAITYLTLAAILARVTENRLLKAYFLLAGVLVTLLVGFSRVYLGVHWPTDVLAGWAAGAAWAVFCWLIARYLQRRGQVEPDAATRDAQV